MAENYLTRAGFDKLKIDLSELRKLKAQTTIELSEAREKGDLKENAEYHSAKERLADLMNRISKVEDQLDTSQMIENLDIKSGEVQIGIKVVLEEKESREKFEWILVGQAESDPANGKISVQSPLAQGILGHKTGETVKVSLPAGEKTFKILKAEVAV